MSHHFSDPVLSKDCPAGIFEPDKKFDPKKKTLLLYLSCHGRTLMEYFKHRPDVANGWNILRFETGPMVTAIQNGIPIFQRDSTKAIFGMADALFTYNMGDRHGELALRKVRSLLKPDAKIITMVAPNCSCLSPISYGYGGGIGVQDAFDNGKTEDQIWKSLLDGTFNPLFNIRWRIEIGRLADKEAYHDVGLAGFIQRNYQRQKLFVAGSHPSYNTMAYLGNECLARIGFEKESEEKIIAQDPALGAIGNEPETDYEFKHFRFQYPMRYQGLLGGLEYFHTMITQYASNWRSGGLIHPAKD